MRFFVGFIFTSICVVCSFRDIDNFWANFFTFTLISLLKNQYYDLFCLNLLVSSQFCPILIYFFIFHVVVRVLFYSFTSILFIFVKLISIFFCVLAIVIVFF